jgi:hypothetical protein
MKTKNRFEASYSLEELLEMNEELFPFWIRPYRGALSAMKVIGYKDDNPYSGYLSGERYSLDHEELLAEEFFVRLDKQKGWLPG